MWRTCTALPSPDVRLRSSTRNCDDTSKMYARPYLAKSSFSRASVAPFSRQTKNESTAHLHDAGLLLQQQLRVDAAKDRRHASTQHCLGDRTAIARREESLAALVPQEAGDRETLRDPHRKRNRMSTDTPYLGRHGSGKDEPHESRARTRPSRQSCCNPTAESRTRRRAWCRRRAASAADRSRGT
jgi:hypothetical protein